MGHHLPLDGGLVLVVLGVPVLLHIPDSVSLLNISVRSNLVLDKTPVRIVLAREPEGGAGVDVDQTDLGVDGVPDIPGRVPVDDVHLPEVLGGHGDVVVDVAGHLLVVRRHGGGHVVRVESSVSETMHQLDDFSMFYPVKRFLHSKIFSVGSLHNPPVVDILEGVAGDLLLMRRTSTISISDRINMFMTVQPTGLSMSMSQSDLTSMNNHLRLTSNNRSKTSIKTCLELAGHQGIMSSCLGQDGEVKREEAEIEKCWNGDQDGCSDDAVGQKLSVTQILPWQESPVVLDQEVETEEAGVDADVFDAEGGGHEQRSEGQPQEPGLGEWGVGHFPESQCAEQSSEAKEHHDRLHQDES